MPPAGYDYRTSGVDEDRRRAQEVYERVERNARQAEQAGDGARGGEGQTANGAGDDKTDEEKQAEAIRRIQGGYRCATPLLSRSLRHSNLCCLSCLRHDFETYGKGCG